ncbi:hypothetical protein GALMADRAFT_247052 [Galerina marginata CBS 339.88]|uniref:Uncharacterized protein n=1 Tax=Galerina marginata (strain CBS 339.88) TaxID=685588 RepID=A0A067T9R4_GALM3|nr:hypothetical protein GALMADRAFT_247052 [Galerina marginata CBS 339.88]
MTTFKLGDDFMRVPKLSDDGDNWVIYKAKFLWSVDARGYLEHVDGTAEAQTTSRYWRLTGRRS